MEALNNVWQCPQCHFILTKMFLRASDGAVGINASTAREVCPNDGVTLVPFEEEPTRESGCT